MTRIDIKAILNDPEQRAELFAAVGRAMCEHEGHNYLVVPIVNINGTSGTELLEQLRNCARSVSQALGGLQQASPHGRDYQCLPDWQRQYIKAREQAQSRFDRLHSVLLELRYLGEEIQKQMDERTRHD